jgi:hypothetical protein
MKDRTMGHLSPDSLPRLDSAGKIGGGSSLLLTLLRLISLLSRELTGNFSISRL